MQVPGKAIVINCRTYKRKHGIPSRFASKRSLHDDMIALVKQHWAEEPIGEAWPAFVLGFSDQHNMSLHSTLLWSDNREKEASFYGISSALKQWDCDRYSFVAETRIKKQDVDTGEITLVHEDAITICTADRKGNALLSSFYKDETGFHLDSEHDFSAGDGIEVGGASTRFLVPGDLYDDWDSQVVASAVEIDADD